MRLYEHQAKALLRDAGVPVPRGGLAASPDEARRVYDEAGWSTAWVKAQIHAGGRGAAGAIVKAGGSQAVQQAAARLLGQRLTTAQSEPGGELVKQVWVEESLDLECELYLAVVVDRPAARIAFLAARQGGVAIAEASRENAVVKATLGADRRLGDAELGVLADALGLGGESQVALGRIAAALLQLFEATDASLIEINPLGVTKAGDLVALGAKMVLDDNALYRHPDLAALRDIEAEDTAALEAARHEINFASLEGNVGCVVNGAGLGLATLDLLKAHGAAPANFMDIRPVATREQVATGFGLLLDDPKVEAILINVFGGGILRCDTIAEGIALALKRRPAAPPLVVRAAGTNAEIGRKVFTGQGIPVTFAGDMEEAAQLVVAASRGGER